MKGQRGGTLGTNLLYYLLHYWLNGKNACASNEPAKGAGLHDL